MIDKIPNFGSPTKINENPFKVSRTTKTSPNFEDSVEQVKGLIYEDRLSRIERNIKEMNETLKRIERSLDS
jgi:hypothetical protein